MPDTIPLRPAPLGPVIGAQNHRETQRQNCGYCSDSANRHRHGTALVLQRRGHWEVFLFPRDATMEQPRPIKDKANIAPMSDSRTVYSEMAGDERRNSSSPPKSA